MEIGNQHRTKYLFVGSENEQDPNLKIRHIRAMEEFMYLGGIIKEKQRQIELVRAKML